MDDSYGSKSRQIIELLETKAKLKQSIFKITSELFEDLKETLHEWSGEINDNLSNSRLIKVEYRDRGKFEAHIQVATDMLIFSMHTNVFHFDRNHSIFDSDYIKSDVNRSYCGVINIYNFLADSFKYNRSSDEGYLIGRIFVNHENHLFVEGKQKGKFTIENFENNEVTKDNLISIIENAIEYSINFDLLVPPYEEVMVIEAEQMNTKIENSRIQTGKRLGYTFNCDDV